MTPQQLPLACPTAMLRASTRLHRLVASAVPLLPSQHLWPRVAPGVGYATSTSFGDAVASAPRAPPSGRAPDEPDLDTELVPPLPEFPDPLDTLPHLRGRPRTFFRLTEYSKFDQVHVVTEKVEKFQRRVYAAKQAMLAAEREAAAERRTRRAAAAAAAAASGGASTDADGEYDDGDDGDEGDDDAGRYVDAEFDQDEDEDDLAPVDDTPFDIADVVKDPSDADTK